MSVCDTPPLPQSWGYFRLQWDEWHCDYVTWKTMATFRVSNVHSVEIIIHSGSWVSGFRNLKKPPSAEQSSFSCVERKKGKCPIFAKEDIRVVVHIEGVRLCFWTAVPNGSFVHLTDNVSIKSHGGMILTGKHLRTRRKACSSANLSTKKPRGLTRARTQDSAGGKC